MIIEFESYFGNCIVTGKQCSKKRLREMLKESLKICDYNLNNIVRIFCSIYNFDITIIKEQKDIQIDFVIDLDTQLIYKPKYNK